MKKLLAGLVIGVFMFCVTGIANAALITQTYNFTFSNFTGPTPPVDPVIGSVSISFDPTRDYGQIGDSSYFEEDGIKLNYLNIALDSPIAFAYLQSEQFFLIGGSANGADELDCAKNDFAFSFSTLYNHQNCSYTQATGYGYSSTSGIVNASTTPTPIPAAIWILGSGISGLAGLRLRKKKSTV